MGEVVKLGPFEKRATKAISTAARFDLVQDLARAVDQLATGVQQLSDQIAILLKRSK